MLSHSGDATSTRGKSYRRERQAFYQNVRWVQDYWMIRLQQHGNKPQEVWVCLATDHDHEGTCEQDPLLLKGLQEARRRSVQYADKRLLASFKAASAKLHKACGRVDHVSMSEQTVLFGLANKCVIPQERGKDDSWKLLDNRMRFLQMTHDAQSCHDMEDRRREASGRPDNWLHYLHFWTVGKAYIGSQHARSDKSRQRDLHMRAVNGPDAISIRDLREKIKVLCNDKDHWRVPMIVPRIPSEWLIEQQFICPNKQHKNASRYTGWFGCTHSSKAYNTRKPHVDEHYVWQHKMNERFTAMKHTSKYCTMVQMDDKQGIVFGEVDLPQAAMPRYHARNPGIISVKKSLSAMDHQVGCNAKVYPSVTMVMRPPAKMADSWNDGWISFILKDAVTQMSTAQRHSIELLQTLIDHYKGVENIPGILLLSTDGGYVLFPRISRVLSILYDTDGTVQR